MHTLFVHVITIADREDPDQMPHNVAFHQCLYCLLKTKMIFRKKKLQLSLKIKTCDPLSYTWTIPSLLHQSRRKNSVVHLRVLLITIFNSKV